MFQNTPDSPSNQNLERSYSNINNIFNFSLTKTMSSNKKSFSPAHVDNDNTCLLDYAEYSENGVTLTVLRPPHPPRPRKLHDVRTYQQLSPPYSSNESSPIQKVPDVDIFNFDKCSEQSVPGSPCHKPQRAPLTPEEKSTTTSGKHYLSL